MWPKLSDKKYSKKKYTTNKYVRKMKNLKLIVFKTTILYFYSLHPIEYLIDYRYTY